VGALIFCLLPLLFPLSYSGRYDFYLVYGLFGAGFLAARHGAAIAGLLSTYATLGFLLATGVLLFAAVTLPWPAIYNNYPPLFIVASPEMVLCSGATPLGAFLENAALRYIGRISYSIYLWQELATSDLFRQRPLLAELAAVLGVVALA